MASSDATPLPIKNQALRITFGLWLTTGLVNSGAAGLDSEVSLDGGSFGDCTNEATEIGSSGSYYLDLVQAELNADTVAIQVKSSTTNAITYKITIYPSSLGKIQVDVRSLLGTAWLTPGTAGTPDVNAKLIGGTAQTGRDIGLSVLLSSGTGTGQVKLASGYVAPNWGDVGNPTTSVGLSGTTIKAVTDGVSLASTAIQAIWDALTSALTTVGSIGKWIIDKLDVAVSTRGTGTALDAAGVRGAVGLASANLDTQLSGIQADTDNLQTRLPAALVGGRMDASVGAMAANVITTTAINDDAITAAKIATDAIGADQLAADAVQEITDGVWDEAIAGHLGAGSTGAALNAAGSAGDPWATPLPGAYGAGTAGKIVGDNLDAPVSGAATPADVPTALQNADAMLNRDMSAVSDTNSFSPLNAMRSTRNAWSTVAVAGSRRVYKEDGTTTAFDQPLTVDPAAVPITGATN